MRVMREGSVRLLEKIKNNKFVLAVLLLGLVLILIPGRSSGEKSAQLSSGEPEFSLSAEEDRIEDALSEVKSAGRVTVVLTLKAGAERVVARDTETRVSGQDAARDSESSVSTVVVSSGASREEPVTLRYIYPEYAGALVVAEGAGSAEVRLCLTRAVAALTGLSTDKITVIKMKDS